MTTVTTNQEAKMTTTTDASDVEALEADRARLALAAEEGDERAGVELEVAEETIARIRATEQVRAERAAAVAAERKRRATAEAFARAVEFRRARLNRITEDQTGLVALAERIDAGITKLAEQLGEAARRDQRVTNEIRILGLDVDREAVVRTIGVRLQTAFGGLTALARPAVMDLVGGRSDGLGASVTEARQWQMKVVADELADVEAAERAASPEAEAELAAERGRVAERNRQGRQAMEGVVTIERGDDGRGRTVPVSRPAGWMPPEPTAPPQPTAEEVDVERRRAEHLDAFIVSQGGPTREQREAEERRASEKAKEPFDPFAPGPTGLTVPGNRGRIDI